MGKENRLWKWLVVLGMTAIAILVLYPPKDKLKPGIDLAGGTSLIYEVDTTGMTPEEKSNLAERVMNILKTRVDPNSQFNLVWRPIGNNRLEIQMPRPPKEAKERRDAYEKARDQIRDKNVTKAEVERALASAGERSDFTALARGVDGRIEKLEAAAKAWDAYVAVRDSDNFEQIITAQSAYEDALEEVMATNLPVGRLTDVLALQGQERKQQLERLQEEYPSYEAAIVETVAAYDAWASGRGTLEDPADLKRLLRGAGVLEFRVLASRDPGNPSMLSHPSDPSLREPIGKYVDQLQKRGPRPKAGDRYLWLEIDNFVKFMQADDMDRAEAARESGSVVVEKYAGKYYVLAHVDEGDQKYGLTRRSPKWSLKRAYPSRDYNTGRPAVDFQLDPRGGAQFAEVTRLNLKRELAIFLDNVAVSHATIQSQIGERGQISGGFTQERVQELVRKLEAGALPARLKETPLQEKNLGPTLGERNRDMGMRAAVYGLGAVVIFMIIYYLFAGVVADIALLLNLLFVLAIMALLEATFTLPGIAGLILTVGMAVDANVLIFERVREERERGIALKKAMRIGYEKALSTIVDANLTTLITCVILGYVGSEEVKGFAMVLGFGVATSMFTALFITRVIFMALIEAGLLKSLPMLRIIRRPNVDWIGLQRVFWPVSIATVVLGMTFFVWESSVDKEAVFDIELLGGTSVLIELEKDADLSAADIRARVTGRGDTKGAMSATEWLRQAAQALRDAKVERAQLTGEFTVTSERLAPTEINDLLRTTFEEHLALGGFSGSGNTAHFVTKPKIILEPTENDPSHTREIPVDLEQFKQGMEEAAAYVEKSATRIEAARVQTVSEIGASGEEPTAFEVITVEPYKELVRSAILGAMGESLKVDQPINYVVATNADKAPNGLFPIRENDQYLGQVIGGDIPIDIREYKGGVALVFDELEPPQTLEAIDTRFKEMRLQPQFEQYESRPYEIFGLTEAGEEDGGKLYKKIAVVAVDENLLYSDDPVQWEERLAKMELEQAEEALSSEKALQKVVQFAPQIASRTQQQALISLVLALAAIVAYVWIRFGTMQYGLAAIVCLVHDVAITLGVLTLGDYLGVEGLRIDLAMIAALLTVVGYSLNDTIVVFDRIRENRGKLANLNTNIINNSINMTLSRSLLTSGTTLLAVAFLFFMGGPGVRGFSFALLCGVIVGTYSSVGIAAPLLQSRKLLHIVVYILIAFIVVAVALTATDNTTFTLVVAGLMAIFVLIGITIERRMDQPAGSLARA